MKGIPSERPFIGVRIPLVREVVTKVPDERITEFLMVEPVAIEEVLAGWNLISSASRCSMVTLGYMKVSGFSKWTFNKTISKICDSHRVNEETKEMLKKMRR